MTHPRSRKGLISVQTAAIFLRIALVALALIIPTTIVGLFIATSIDTAGLEADILVQWILYSPNGLGYLDTASQQAPLGIIDADKLAAAMTDRALDKEITSNDPRQGAKITIGDKTAYYNKGLYNDYAPLARTRLPGLGGARRFVRQLPVVLRENGHDTVTTATIEVITPR